MPNLSAAEQAIDVCQARVEVFATYISTDSTKKQHVFYFYESPWNYARWVSTVSNQMNNLRLYSTFQPNSTKEYFPPKFYVEPLFHNCSFQDPTIVLVPFFWLFSIPFSCPTLELCFICYFCSELRRKQNIYVRCGFSIQSVFTARNYSFQQNCFIPNWRYRFLEFKFKKIIHLRLFFVKF